MNVIVAGGGDDLVLLPVDFVDFRDFNIMIYDMYVLYVLLF